MTVSEMKKKLQKFEDDGLGDNSIFIEVSNQKCLFELLKVEGGILLPERVVIKPHNSLWFQQ